MAATDPEISKRTWQQALNVIVESKKGSTQLRWRTAANDKAFNRIRNRPVVETTGEELLQVLKAGTISTNAYLRKLHNLLLGNELAALAHPAEETMARHRIRSKTGDYVGGT